MKQVLIFDLDNCVADDEWRIQHIDWSAKEPMERYHKYHSLSAFDKPRHDWSEVKQEDYDIYIFTARPELYRPQTEEWLVRNGIEFKQVFMRSNDNHFKSAALKEFMLSNLLRIIEKDSILAAFDDRPDIVEMYKKNGIDGQILKCHNVCAYTPPSQGEQQ